MMTPEEARELWCPMVRIARREDYSYETLRTGGDPPLVVMRTDHHVVAGCNRDALGSPTGFVLNSCKCIASQCAMWRWQPSTTTHKERRIETKRYAFPGGVIEDRCVEINVNVPDAPTHGYCGLAGRPEVMA